MQREECLTIISIFVQKCFLNHNWKGLQNYDIMNVYVQSYQWIPSLKHVHLFNVLFL